MVIQWVLIDEIPKLSQLYLGPICLFFGAATQMQPSATDYTPNTIKISFADKKSPKKIKKKYSTKMGEFPRENLLKQWEEFLPNKKNSWNFIPRIKFSLKLEKKIIPSKKKCLKLIIKKTSNAFSTKKFPE